MGKRGEADRAGDGWKAVSIVIIGGGHAGGSVAAYLRQFGCKDAIELVCEEPVAPYQRPPLSKAWLKSDMTLEQILLRPEAFYGMQSIGLRLGERAVAIDRAAKTIGLASGARLPYGKLIIATGSGPRILRIPGYDLAGVHYLRDKSDADALKRALVDARSVIVIGGGYVGLEVAASARGLGREVAVVEREARLLARVASPAISDFFARYHAGKGVQVLLGRQVASIEGAAGRVAGVRLADGAALAGDLVVVGVGAVPNQELAQLAGLQCADGIVVDARARTSDPDIYAIGDCTFRPLALYGPPCRLESVANANEQAKQAASDICGREVARIEPPWFWSDQFDLRLQMAGLAIGVAQTSVRGSMEAAKFAVVHTGAEGRLRAVEAVNMPAEFMAGKAALAKLVA